MGNADEARMTGHAEIAGGGFTGLTMGTALAQAGWTVRVHERSPEIRAFGAGIWIWDNGVRVLKAIGAADEALEGCTEAPTYISRDARGRFIDEMPFAPVTSTDRSRMFCITRQQLLSAMLGAAERAGVEIVTSSTATGARADGTLLTEDGREWPADLVIAADGINSRVRDSLDLLKSRKAHVDGAIRVLVPHEPGYADSEEGRTIREWWNGHRRVLYTPCNGEVFYLCFTMLARDAAASRVPLPRALWSEAFPHLRSMIERVPDEGRYDRFETIKLKAGARAGWRWWAIRRTPCRRGSARAAARPSPTPSHSSTCCASPATSKGLSRAGRRASGRSPSTPSSGRPSPGRSPSGPTGRRGSTTTCRSCTPGC